MKKRLYNYKHIVSNNIREIENPHPLDNIKDKSIFINFLVEDLNVCLFEDISDMKKNLFRIYLDNLYYNVFIEFPDGGGTDISLNRTSKKVAIPYHLKAFKKIINDYERVLVINMYVPLDDNLIPDFSKRTYLIISPNEVYSSKVIDKGTNNSSSRWFKLEDIIDVIENKEYKMNNKKNMYIVPWEKLKWFFDNILRKEYLTMISDEISKINLLDLKNENTKKYKKYRRLFRELLISNRGVECEILTCNISIVELLIASHIKPVNCIVNDNTLDTQQKIKEICDPNNGFLLCPNHDALFDKFLITFNSEGTIKISKSIINQVLDFNLILDEKCINISDKQVIKYLNFHNEKFSLDNK